MTDSYTNNYNMNKKYLLDLSLEIETSDIIDTGKPNILITKEIDGMKIVLDLPVDCELVAQGFIADEIYDHYWNAQSTERRKGTGGFWLREKTEKDEGRDSGLNLSLSQK